MESIEDLVEGIKSQFKNEDEFLFYVWTCYLTFEMGKSYCPTVEQLEDLHAALVGGVLCNLGSGKTPEYMEGIGPDENDRNTLESWWKMRLEIMYSLGGMKYPFEEWKNENKDSCDWIEIIRNAQKLDKQFETNPEEWCIGLMNKKVTAFNPLKITDE